MPQSMRPSGSEVDHSRGPGSLRVTDGLPVCPWSLEQTSAPPPDPLWPALSESATEVELRSTAREGFAWFVDRLPQVEGVSRKFTQLPQQKHSLVIGIFVQYYE